jgi:xanthine dehydrogenase accessory factor
MVVSASGQTGTVGGGSMEYRARQDALSLLSENACAFRSYDIHADASGNAAGSVTILFRPFSGESGRALCKEIRDALETGLENYLVCQLMEPCEQESCVVSAETLCAVCGIDCAPEEASVINHETGWFAEPIQPAPRVILFGGGHVAQCVARQLALLEYRIWVIEDREAFAKQELFPMAERVLFCDYNNVQAQLNITRRDHGIVMSRGHETDEQILSWLLRSEADYIGCIGSRRKIAQIREHLIAQGVSQEQLERLHAPIGLDIGAETPAEIAVGIAAELIQYCSAR